MTGNFGIVLPAVILAVGAFIIYLLARLVNLHNRSMALLTVITLAASLAALVWLYFQMPDLQANPDAIFGSQDKGGIIYRADGVGVFILMVGVVIGMLITLYSGEYLSRDARYMTYYPLVLLTLAGLMGMFMSNNLFNFFMLAELTTISASALVAFRFQQEIAIKAGFKYLIMSSLGTMTMLLGIYFVYRSTGSMHLDQMLANPDNFTRFGAACFLLGFSLKAGVVPLHTWVPDVYGHAPSAVSGLLAGIFSKSMLFIIPVVCLRLGMTMGELGGYLMIFACFNMLLGSVRMLRQLHYRRFLSFSSIGQTGYLMFGLGMGLYFDLDQAFAAGLFLFLVIAVMKCLAFLSAGIYQYYTGSQNINQLQGIGKLMPGTSFSFSVALAGLAGIPLLAGFTGKWLIFSAALVTRDLFSIICLVVFMISTLVSLGGYLPTLVKQYQEESEFVENLRSSGTFLLKVSPWMILPVDVLALLVIVMGVYPAPWINLVNHVIQWVIL